jgi:hypothetical protein
MMMMRFMFLFLSFFCGLTGKTSVLLLLDAEVLGGGFENHAVNGLFGTLTGISARFHNY